MSVGAGGDDDEDGEDEGDGGVEGKGDGVLNQKNIVNFELIFYQQGQRWLGQTPSLRYLWPTTGQKQVQGRSLTRSATRE